MLISLSIKNYVLIDNLQINFKEGLSTITGETGAGKSILLGALGLVLGDRADLSTIKKTDKKCVIEAIFNVKNYPLQDFFNEADLDYEDETIIRREILPSGKSRAFLNDTPVTLNTLQNLSQFLIDIHSQQDAAKLNELAYQYNFIDAIATTKTDLIVFTQKLHQLRQKEKELQLLKETQTQKQQAFNYNLFLFEELNTANLQADELEILETAIEKLEHIDQISQSVSNAIQLGQTEDIGLSDNFQKFVLAIKTIAKYDASFEPIADRTDSLKIEFDDIQQEILDYQENIDSDPQELDNKQLRLNVLNALLQKHRVTTIAELIVLKEQFEVDIDLVNNAETDLLEKEAFINNLTKELLLLGAEIHKKREHIIPNLQTNLEKYLSKLGMQNAKFCIELSKTNQIHANGIDTLAFLFKANKGGEFGKISKVASGGERSRIMLALKAILSNYSKLPTIIFDEIDTGVSGEVANTVGLILQKMAKNMQVMAITHLPQIAAKGAQHYKVYKEVALEDTKTYLKILNQNERVAELAEMLGGKKITESAVVHAKSLLQ
ncbi:MAG: DNA repair protein RecN [Flavobacteriales bacterium]|nr:DNA repair protein RecN [Flavobacteriales bacterium]